MKRVLAVMALILSVSSAHALTAEQNKHYKIGARMIECSAYFRLTSEAALAVGQQDTATALENLKNGWELAGMFVLADGLEDPTRTRKVTASIQDAMLARLKGQVQLEGDKWGDLAVKQFDADCRPYLEYQESIIQFMRQQKTQ
ncbi:hypothetical protein G5V57_24330 [Nordella sp. HKS 07]|uniref:hypothetical protein n=1 Tax=Nordella sp. HKS 07 TaxID=2712222 RepID=UPI0013E1D3D2|nr:hypothetical protein [Nordella sp. HKS 07]QIG50580.1 hypothetical protein G5V57_24330 [Nordella sp. HKS 07]